MKNVFILPEYWSKSFIGACGWIRLLEPLLHNDISSEYHVEFGYSLDEAREKPAIVIIERLWHPKEVNIPEYERMMKMLKGNGINIIYSIDDNLVDYPLYQKSDWHSSIYNSVINLFLHYADIVVVPTPALQERFSSYHKRIMVIPNAIDVKQIRQKENNTNDKIKFGYLASPDNWEYLYSIIEPLRSVLCQYENHVSFEIIGTPYAYLSTDLFHSLPVEVKIPPDPSYKQYHSW
ncbi:MAG: hypothetical protein HQ542_12930, partial [Bacteroidia bacterium]|nr:hypothetical protein [Bacteroidia bacterium]